MYCHGMTTNGRGIASVNGKTVFVSGALADESVMARYTRVRKDFDEAVAVSIEQGSRDRVVPPCQYFGTCGGCTFQHLDYPEQLRLKQREINYQLGKLPQDTPPEVFSPLTSEPYAYRHRIRLSIQVSRGELILGFKQSASHQVIAIEQCLLVSDYLNKLISPLRQQLRSLSSMRLLNAVELIADADGRLALMLVAKQNLPAADLQQLKSFAADHVDLLLLRSGHLPAVTLYEAAEDLALVYQLRINALQLDFLPGDFTQVNPDINEQMIQRCLEWLMPGADDKVLDLFCGIGNFTLPLAKCASSVEGVELDSLMLAKARSNALKNNIHNVEFKAIDLFAGGFRPSTTCNKAILDPPRAGADWVVGHLSSWGVKELVYISCNPATFFRDAATLIQCGYRLEKLGLLDMFPQTSHCELISYFKWQ